MRQTITYLICIISVWVLNISTVQSQNFTESSQALGIRHYQYAKNFMGGGAAFFDYDNDGYEDVYLTGGERAGKLFRNVGGTHFEDVTRASGIADLIELPNAATSVFTGDINNDGYRDLFIGRQKTHNLLFLNNGDGTFSDITESSGLLAYEAFTMGAAMGDYNLDGLLDIYVINYIEIPSVDDQGFYHTCYANWLFLNNGDNTFTESAESTAMDDTGCGLAVTFTDYNQDSRPDLYIANDFGAWITPNALFENQDGTVATNVSESTNMDVGIYGMGIAQGDFNKDGLFDYYITNLGRNVLMQNMGNNQFSDVTANAGVENTYVVDDTLSVGWGTIFLDYDHDGHDDLFVANGEVRATPFLPTTIDDPNKLFRNKGDETFEDVSDAMGVNGVTRGRGLAAADFDKDGDMDVLIAVVDNQETLGDRHYLFYVNNVPTADQHWLKVKLKGIYANADAFGAVVKMYANNKIWLREMGGGGSHASQHATELHIGLGDLSMVDSMVVTWPGGKIQRFYDIASKQTILIVEDEAEVFPENCVNGSCTYGIEHWIYLESPTNVTSTFVGPDNGVLISWDDQANEELSYRIERATAETPDQFELLADLPANTTSYHELNALAGKSYTYRISAMGQDHIKNSKPSEYISVSMKTVPDVPTNLVCSFNEFDTRNELMWTSYTVNIDSFYVEKAIGTSPIFAEVAVVGKGVQSWHDPSIVLGQQYRYRIRTANTNWYSDYHAEVNIISQVTGLADLSKMGEISLYPNPAKGGQLHLSLEGALLRKPIHLQILDMTGKVLKQETLYSQGTNRYQQVLNLGNYGAGYYLVKFQSELGVYTTKIIYLD